MVKKIIFFNFILFLISSIIFYVISNLYLMSKLLSLKILILYLVLYLLFNAIFIKGILNIIEKYFNVIKDNTSNFENFFLKNTENNLTEMNSYFLKMFTTLKFQMLELTQKEIEIHSQKEKAEALRKDLQELNDNLGKKIKERTTKLEQAKILAEKANRAKDEFLAKVSHEMRTPLTPIIGFSKELLALDCDSNTKRKLSIINSSGTKLLNLTNELLEISKLEHGHTNIFKTQFNLKDLIEEIYLDNKDLALKKNLSFKINYPINGPFFIISDEMKIYKIINNLVENAIKYTEIGYVHVHITFNMNNLHIRVSDSGVGIDSKYKEKIFDFFEQIKTDSPGLGLGLNIVKNLVYILEGSISVISKLNNGSQFLVDIPIVFDMKPEINSINFYLQWTKNKSPEFINIINKALLKLPKKIEKLKCFIKDKDLKKIKQIIHETKGVYGNLKINEIYSICSEIDSLLIIEKDYENLLMKVMDSINKILVILDTLPFNQIFSSYLVYTKKKINILIAEDNEENSEYLEILFKKKNISHTIVRNGVLIFEQISKKKIDIILMDIQMPIMDGIEALKIIRDKKIEVPVIALTAQSVDGDKEKMLKLGFNDYVSKPIDTSLLFSIIEDNFKEERSNETFNS